MPTSLDFAAECLGKETERWSGADTLSLYSAASEMLAWVNDERRYVHRFHYAAWSCSIRDLNYCLDNIGTSLRELIRPTRDNITSSIQECLKDSANPKRDNIRKSLQELLEILRSPQASLACWQDFLRACKRPEYSMLKIAKLRDEFWDTAKAGEYNRRELNSLLKGILSNELQSVYQVKVLLGEDVSEFPTRVRDRVRKTATLDNREREQLCARIVGRSPRVAHHVVWLIYTPARLTNAIVDVGPVQLFHGPTLRDMSPDNPIFPAELNSASSDYKHMFPEEEEDFVMVRVDLGTRATTDAASLARKQAMTVILAASQRASGLRGTWNEGGSQIHIMDGRVVSQVFSRSGRMPVTSFQLDPLAHGINLAAPRVAACLSLDSRVLQDLLEYLNLWDKVKEYDAASAILANVRLIESLSSYTSDTDWVQFCNRTFKNRWIRKDLLWKLHEVLHDATYGSSNFVDARAQSIIDRVRERVFWNEDGLLYSDGEAALDCLHELSELYPERQLAGYKLRSLERDYSNCARLNHSRKLLIGRWDRAMERLEKTRNALTHGGPVTEEALVSVSAFSQKLAGGLIGVAIDQSFDGRDISDTMDDLAERGSEWEKNSYIASTPKSFLYGPLSGT
ncbi:hypothetical protein ABZ490_39380 [Streptomyces sp. NPDC005811]|uniref:hypothetical protein n=1 Tax=Streptomyces sp. NPDC005811 TaxID=3154565 RepID=UPI0033DE305D